jgi:hypothetical protein
MDGPERPIDRTKLRAAVRRLGKDYAYLMLEDAIELLPQPGLRQLISPYIDVATLRADDGDTSAGSLRTSVEAFARASLAGKFYEPFEVDSRNFTQRSAGTLSWTAECRRLFERCARDDSSVPPTEIRGAFDTLFCLLDRVDKCLDDVVFFADEAGSWQVGVDWQGVLPAWFAVLATTAEPEEFARHVVERVRRHCSHKASELLAIAGTAATPAQRAALARIAVTPRVEREAQSR